MKRAFYFMLVLGFTQSFCRATGITYTPQKNPAYAINNISGDLQNHIKLFDAEDFEPDFGIFCYTENSGIYLQYFICISYSRVRHIICKIHLILAFISDIPPPC